jgi:hypothetical protein
MRTARHVRGILFVVLAPAVPDRPASADPMRYARGGGGATLGSCGALRHRVEANWPSGPMPAVSAASPERVGGADGFAPGSSWVAAVALTYLEMVTPVRPSPEEMIRRGHGGDHVAQR